MDVVMMGSQSFPHILLSTPSTICPPIPSHLSSFMFPLGERIPTSLSWRRSVRGPLLNPHWLHPPQRREMICLSFKDKMVSLPVFLYIHLFLAVLGLHCCTGFSLVAASGGYSSWRCVGFSLWWLLLLQTTGSRAEAQEL